jgi:hypothetical protein
MTRIRNSPCYADFIMDAVVQRGEIRSLFEFCVQNGLDYSHALFLVRQLNTQGVLKIEHLPSRGHPLLIRKGSVPYVS